MPVTGKGCGDPGNDQQCWPAPSRQCLQLQGWLCTPPGQALQSSSAIRLLLTALLPRNICLLHLLLKSNVLCGTVNLGYRCIYFFLFLSFFERGAKHISKVPKWVPLKISISVWTPESNRWEPVSNSFTFCVIWRKTDLYIQSGLFQKIVLWKMKGCSKVKSDYFRRNEKLQCQPYCLNQQKIKALHRIGNWRFSLNLHFFLLSTFLLQRERTS